MSQERLTQLRTEMEAWRGKNKYLFEKALDEYKLLQSSSKTTQVESLIPPDRHAPPSSKTKSTVTKTPGGLKGKKKSLLRRISKN